MAVGGGAGSRSWEERPGAVGEGDQWTLEKNGPFLEQEAILIWAAPNVALTSHLVGPLRVEGVADAEEQPRVTWGVSC